MIINHNCCIKLVPFDIFIYDAQSHIHQIAFKCIFIHSNLTMQNYHLVMLFIVIPVGKQLTTFCADITCVYTCAFSYLLLCSSNL